MSATSRERVAIDEVRDALGSSLSLREVMRAAQAPLLQLLGADHAALGVASGGPALGGLDWLSSDGLPAAFFDEYASWAAHDFVLKAVSQRPRVVLSDVEMVSRAALERNPIHHRARELGAPLEHVMAVMLDVGDPSSGLAVYRERRRPFGDREQALLRALVPALAQAVRRCRQFESAEQRARVLEAVLTHHDRALVVVDARGSEQFCTEPAARLLERWFSGGRRSSASSSSTNTSWPEPLSSAIRRWLARPDDTTPTTFWRSASTRVLVVEPIWVAAGGRSLLSLVLEERPRPPWSPAAWARVTPRQRAVVAAVVRGWDNQLIASELGCRVATVKRHLTQIFDALGVGSRSQLMAAALTMPRDSVYSSVQLRGPFGTIDEDPGPDPMIPTRLKE